MAGKKTFPILSLITVLGLLLTAYFADVTRSQTQNKPNVDEHKKLADAIRRGGYKEAAKIKGHYVESVDPNWDWASFNLETLTKGSAAVVVGIPENSQSELSASGDMITTIYEVKVQEAFKGQLNTGVVFKVALPGGRVDFEDGTSAEIRTPKFEQMLEGKEYLLFLYANRNGSDVFLLTGGPQGLFELKSNGVVKAHGRAMDPGVKEIQDMSADHLRQKVRDYAHKWPEIRQCCG